MRKRRKPSRVIHEAAERTGRSPEELEHIRADLLEAGGANRTDELVHWAEGREHITNLHEFAAQRGLMVPQRRGRIDTSKYNRKHGSEHE